MFAPRRSLTHRDRLIGRGTRPTVSVGKAGRPLTMLAACLIAASVLASSAAAAPAASPAQAMSAPVVSGVAQNGDLLATSNGTWSGSPTSYTYGWQRCSSSGCSNIAGAVYGHYTLHTADVGSTIRSVVTATNSGGSTSATSAQTSTVTQIPPPVTTAAPVVSGTAQQGQVLTTTNGSWSGYVKKYTYQWQRCSAICAKIVGATASSYTLQPADVGNTVQSVVTASNAGGAVHAYSAQTATVAGAGSPPANSAAPVVTGTAQQGQVLTTSNGTWSGSPTSYAYQWQRCSSACSNISGATASSYTLQATDVGDTVLSVVTATNSTGSASADSTQTGTVVASGGGAPSYFSTVPSSQNGAPPAGIPRSDATCASWVRPAPENRPQNTTANHSVPSDPSTVGWNPGLSYWSKFVADRNLVTGNYTGTTDEILQWVACKWGIDEDIVRADAVVESDWIQSTTGDNCGASGEASYGILQVKNKDCSGKEVHGGWPYTQNDTALDADYWGARLRACFDGAFYDGGYWRYNGQSIAQVIAAHGQDYALWGCVGSWYSGSWYDSGAQGYITSVQNDYQSKPWLNPGF
jgi:hypothetical protein